MKRKHLMAVLAVAIALPLPMQQAALANSADAPSAGGSPTVGVGLVRPGCRRGTQIGGPDRGGNG